MGYDAYSKVVFGLKVNKEQTVVEKQVRSCNHDVDTNSKFCSECGKPIYKIVKEEIVDEGYNKDEIGYFTSSADSTSKGILGFILAKTEDQDTNYYAIPEPKEKMLNKLKAFLVSNKIPFEESDLKAYLYTYHSY